MKRFSKYLIYSSVKLVKNDYERKVGVFLDDVVLYLLLLKINKKSLQEKSNGANKTRMKGIFSVLIQISRVHIQT